jgi:predicted RNA-binding Zn-ribbon protein involved in translation (DUF1610 family)
VWQRPSTEPCPTCGSLMVFQPKGAAKCTSCGTVVETVEETAVGE